MSFVIIKDLKLPTVVAISDEEKQKGLMYVESVPGSMSFVFEEPCVNKFWMQNTKVALDIIFTKSGKIIDISKGVPYSIDYVGPDKESDLVVEVPYGFCSKNNIKIGDSVKLKMSIDKLAAYFEKKISSY